MGVYVDVLADVPKVGKPREVDVMWSLVMCFGGVPSNGIRTDGSVLWREGVSVCKCLTTDVKMYPHPLYEFVCKWHPWRDR